MTQGHHKRKSYRWTTAPWYYTCAPTHRAFTEKEWDALEKAVPQNIQMQLLHMAWNNKMNIYRDTLDVDVPDGVKDLIDWEKIHIPRRTAQECKDEWYSMFDPYLQPVCLSRDKRFWRIQYYRHIVDSQKKTAGHPAFVYHGVIGTHPHGYLIPHTSTTEVQQLIREKKTQGYDYIHDFTHTGVLYLLYDDLRKMPVGTEFTVGSNSETHSPSGTYGIQRVKVKEHLEHYTNLHDPENPSNGFLYQLFRGSLNPPTGGWSSSEHSKFADFHSTLAVYINRTLSLDLNDKHSDPRIEQIPASAFFHHSLKSKYAERVYPLVVNPNPQDPIYYKNRQPLSIQRVMNDLYVESRKAVVPVTLIVAGTGALANRLRRRRLRSRRNRLKSNASWNPTLRHWRRARSYLRGRRGNRQRRKGGTDAQLNV